MRCADCHADCRFTDAQATDAVGHRQAGQTPFFFDLMSNIAHHFLGCVLVGFVFEPEDLARLAVRPIVPAPDHPQESHDPAVSLGRHVVNQFLQDDRLVGNSDNHSNSLFGRANVHQQFEVG